ncbi:hypothetical protein SAMN05216207_102113 [Pseudonocardia ammonioxydans]|uniref:Uncharacterized protein n=1 Tax=Pseudonocardia ammonioxydans TaxID=260086 RepID=A0A1I5BRN9_PSUAM|nr:hypothetical protein [Pseudonocardia ammonioxydans]SFN77313.1 hypothetical protein SAMN05216207_102113 [Pseudonocardia ammonioxydans]
MSLFLLVNPALVPAGGLLPAGPAGAAALGHALVPAAAPAGPFDGAPLAVTLLRSALLVGLAVVAGAGLVRPLARGPVPTERIVATVAALVASGAAIAATVWSGSGTPLWAAGLVVAVAAVPVLLHGGRPATAVLPGAVVAALLASVLSSARGAPVPVALDAGYAVAVALLAGAVLHLFAHRAVADEAPLRALADPDTPTAGPDDRPGTGRVRVLAVVAGTAATGAGLAQLLLTGPFSVIDLVGTGYGRSALVAVAGPALATVLVVAERAVTGRGGHATGRARARGTRDRFRATAGVAAVAGVAAASVLAALPPPAAAAEPGQLLARTVDLGSGALTLVVSPMRPGPNLVQLTDPGVVVPAETGAAVSTAAAPMPGHGGPDAGPTAPLTVRVGDRDVPVTGRAGAPGGWALVDLPAGTDSLSVHAGGASRTVPVDVGTERTTPAGATGADGPECASAVLGAVVAAGPGSGDVTDCPSESLRPGDEQALRETVRALGARGIPGIAIAADASPRSRAAAEAVRAEAAAAGVPVRPRAGADGGLVVVSGWQDAARVARETAYAANTEPTALGGTYLAPWLLTGGVLGSAQSAVLPLPFGPQEPLPQRYVRALALTVPGSAPSTSGLLAWADAAGEQVEQPYGWHGAAPVSVPMSVEPGDGPGHHGGPNTAAWFPGGAVAAIGPIGAPAASPTP